MPITSLTWTSRQARTQRLHWMQASSCTAIAGWLRSGGGGAWRGKRLSATPNVSAQCHRREEGSCAAARDGLIADQQFEDHLARKPGSLARGLNLHAGGRLA